MSYVTDAKAMKMMEEIVAEHAPQILLQLGFAKDDEILNKINILPTDEVDTPHGETQVQTKSDKYVKGTASIYLYPLSCFSYKKKNGKNGRLPFIARFMHKQIRRLLIHTLAHELRHYWQHDSGEYFRNEPQVFGISIMPYNWRWCEKDANQFARDYLVSIGLIKLKK